MDVRVQFVLAYFTYIVIFQYTMNWTVPWNCSLPVQLFCCSEFVHLSTWSRTEDLVHRSTAETVWTVLVWRSACEWLFCRRFGISSIYVVVIARFVYCHARKPRGCPCSYGCFLDIRTTISFYPQNHFPHSGRDILIRTCRGYVTREWLFLKWH